MPTISWSPALTPPTLHVLEGSRMKAQDSGFKHSIVGHFLSPPYVLPSIPLETQNSYIYTSWYQDGLWPIRTVVVLTQSVLSGCTYDYGIGCLYYLQYSISHALCKTKLGVLSMCLKTGIKAMLQNAIVTNVYNSRGICQILPWRQWGLFDFYNSDALDGWGFLRSQLPIDHNEQTRFPQYVRWYEWNLPCFHLQTDR